MHFPLPRGFISGTPNSAEMEKIPCPQSHRQQNPFNRKTPSSHGSSLIQERFEKESPHTIQIFLQAWRESTNKQYQVYFIKWINFCQERGLNSSLTCLKTILDFLTPLFKEGLSYSSINSAKSAFFYLCHHRKR